MQKDPEENHEGTQSGYLKDRLRFESFICRITFFFLITWSRILLKGLIVPLLANKFSRFYETQQFMTVFTSDCHLPLSRARSIQSTPLSRFLNNHFNSISLLQLGIPHCYMPLQEMWWGLIHRKTSVVSIWQNSFVVFDCHIFSSQTLAIVNILSLISTQYLFHYYHADHKWSISHPNTILVVSTVHFI